MGRSSIPCLLLLCACGANRAVVGEESTTDTGTVDCADTGNSGDTGNSSDTTDTGEDLSAWDGASLVVNSPQPGDFIPLGQPADFEAMVLDASGDAFDFDEIWWSSSIDSGWEAVGRSFQDDSLSAGAHVITAEATLPNGDHLVVSVGTVMVQHENAGTYFGDMSVDLTIDYKGQSYTATCIGAATLIVDITGEGATGESSCRISVNGSDLDANHIFEFALDEAVVGGDATIDLGWVGYSFAVEGEVGDGELVALWADDVAGYADIAGELDVTRITRQTELSD